MDRQRFGGAMALLLVVACGGGSDGPAAECQTAADCDAGQVCDAGTCRVAAPPCDPGCADPTPVCDVASGACKTCTEDEGCRGAAPVCDTAANGGQGACVGCRDTADCRAPSVCDAASLTCVGCTETEGCGDDTPICEEGRCVACTATRGCEGEQFCDLSFPGGECVLCTATEGCEDGQLCDLSISGGACVTCTAYAGCDGGRFCDLSVPGGECVVCTADGSGCVAEAPYCDTGVPGGACVECLGDGACGTDEFCDPGRGRCVVCDDSDRGCVDPAPRCDVDADDGRGACVGCLDAGDCAVPTPHCHPEWQRCVACLTNDECGEDRPYCRADGSACLECVGASDCAADQSCDHGSCRPTVSLQLQAVRDAPNDASLALPVQEALVTYVRPATGEFESAGFFVQGERTGPALLVAIDPATLDPTPQVGDRVSFEVTAKTVNNGATLVMTIVDWAIASRENDVRGLIQDLTDATDPITGLDAYEGELVSFSGTITSEGLAVWGFTRSQFTTAGMTTPSPSLRLRLPAGLRDTLGLTTGCTFRLLAGPMWRNGSEANPSAYRAEDLSGITCP